jgi:CubicO group peptidase (beta-lactamase class C family)
LKTKRFIHLFVSSLLLVAILFSPVACGISRAMAPGSPEPLSGPELERVLLQFERQVEKALRDFQVPGMAVAVVQGDKVVYSKGFGVKEAGKQEPVDPHTRFQVGSTSKAFTATLVASLVDQGKVGWKDPVISHLPDFAMYDPWVTKEFQVRDLMAQHSGMKPYAGDILAMIGYGREDIVRSTAHIAPVTSFRSEFAYVNNLWVTAAAVVEAKTGKTWEQNIQEGIFEPLGMSESSTSQEALFKSGNAATFHMLAGNKVKPIARDWPLFDWPYVYGPAGGINSNVMDMAKWVRMQLGKGTFQGKKVVGKEALAFTHEPQTPIAGGKNAYCLGWVKSDYKPCPLIWHNGATTGSGTLVMTAPDLDLGIVILSNLVTPAPDNLGLVFMDLYTGNKPDADRMETALEGWRKKLADEEKKASRPKDATAPLANAAYAGTYESPLFGTALLLERQGKLVLRLGPKGFELNLEPRNRDNFSMKAAGLDEDDAGSIRFDVGVDGKAFAFDFQDSDGDILGRFNRKDTK